MVSHFFATLSRMKYIQRWALMRQTRPENLSEHSLEVAMISHMLCTIGNVRYGKHLDAREAALIAMFHDASEIITGDMPTPVKYYNDDIRDSYKMIEAAADEKLLSTLPDDLRPAYEEIFHSSNDPDDIYIRRLVKAADKISALIKCIEEQGAGNGEFKTAIVTIQSAVDRMREELPEAADFVREFLPPYGSTLDELT